MKISKQYISITAKSLLRNSPIAMHAYQEVEQSIIQNITPGYNEFLLNNSSKHCNGVTPVKEECYRILEEEYHWFREKPLIYFHDDAQKGGPIDVYKEFLEKDNSSFCVGLEFETGNISSAHRSMNKLCVGYLKHELQLAMLMMPVNTMSYFLTDRVANYEELEPYFILLGNYPFIVFGFDADVYCGDIAPLAKGNDGMSSRAIRKWHSNR